MKTLTLHACMDLCLDWAGRDLFRRRCEQSLDAYPWHRRVLKFVRHQCGPWCVPPDSGGPVRLGREGEWISHELGLSPAAAGLLARLRERR